MLGHQFTCNVCSKSQIFNPTGDWREAPSCGFCGSSVRSRQLVHCLSLLITGKSSLLSDIKSMAQGCGLSDPLFLAEKLQKSFNYTNTFYHKEPLLDICLPDKKYFNQFDFLISSDVFEHVSSPVESAFNGVMSVLKPGGVLVLTVPYDGRNITSEHFAGLSNLKLVEYDESWVLIARDTNNNIVIKSDLVFHGGPGSTLEMRFFSKDDLIQLLIETGFVDIVVHDYNVPEFGIFPPHEQGLPITARKPL